MTARVKTPSEAQARALAWIWARRGSYELCPTSYICKTDSILLKNGWIEPTRETGIWPSGLKWTGHRVSPAGFRALHQYLVMASGKPYWGMLL